MKLLSVSSTFGVLLGVQLVAHTAAQSATASASGGIQTHVIAVGNGDHKFRPEVTQAEIGDIIEFQFFPPNHSVVRAEYKYPCIPYEMTGRGKTGFFAGFHPVDAILADPPKWRIRVNDTDPIFFYCSAIGSCIDYGMVGVINPNASTSLEVQRELARDSAYMLQPGDPFPSEGSTSDLPKATSSRSSSSSTAAATDTATAAATTTALAAGGSHGLGAGPIAGIVVGCVAILGLAAALFFYIGRSKTLKQEVDRQSGLPGPGLYPHSYLDPRSPAGMSDTASRKSGAASPRMMPYDNHGMMGMAVMTEKPGCVVNVEETGYSRATDTRSPSERGYASNTNSTATTVPIRHPSVLLNPNDPREMYSPDQRWEQGERF